MTPNQLSGSTANMSTGSSFGHDPLVSVIMPSHNSGEFIGAAIESVLAQTYYSLELIIVDDSSSDNTRAIIKTYNDRRIRLFAGDFNRLIATSRNHAARNARGELLAFLDSDDIWEPTKLASQLEHLINPDICCVASNFVPVGNTTRCINHLKFRGGATIRDFSHDEVIVSNPVVLSSAIVRAKEFFEVGMFDEDPRFFAIEDWELWMRLSKRGPIRILADPLVRYRLAFARKRDTRKVTLNSLAAIRRHADTGLRGAVVSAAYGNCYANIGRAFLDYGDTTGVMYYIKALRYGKGTKVRLRSLWGLILFAFPPRVRENLLAAAYRVHARLWPS